MTIEIKPEVKAAIDEQLQSGRFKSVDDLLASALSELATRNSKLNRQRLAIEESAGAWRDEDHPELAGGSAAWVHEIRAASNDRMQRIEQHRRAK